MLLILCFLLTISQSFISSNIPHILFSTPVSKTNYARTFASFAFAPVCIIWTFTGVCQPRQTAYIESYHYAYCHSSPSSPNVSFSSCAVITTYCIIFSLLFQSHYCSLFFPPSVFLLEDSSSRLVLSNLSTSTNNDFVHPVRHSTSTLSHISASITSLYLFYSISCAETSHLKRSALLHREQTLSTALQQYIKAPRLSTHPLIIFFTTSLSQWVIHSTRLTRTSRS